MKTFILAAILVFTASAKHKPKEPKTADLTAAHLVDGKCTLNYERTVFKCDFTARQSDWVITGTKIGITWLPYTSMGWLYFTWSGEFYPNTTRTVEMDFQENAPLPESKYGPQWEWSITEVYGYKIKRAKN
jgi:hypothetical protein